MKEKMTIVLGIGVTTLVVFTFGFYLLANPRIELFHIISIPILLTIILTSTYIIYDKWKNIKEGLPTQDERLKLAAYRAGYYGFIAAIWGALGSNWCSIILYDQDLPGNFVVAAVVLISGFVFMASYLYFSRKGD